MRKGRREREMVFERVKRKGKIRQRGRASKER